jgi:hypothetical protein
VELFGLFVTWLRHAGPQASGVQPAPAGQLLAGPDAPPARGVRRVNAVLAAVRGFVVHAVTTDQAPGRLLPLIYELADDRDLPAAARGEQSGMAWRMRARHRLREPETPVDRATDGEIVALLGACRSARDRSIGVAASWSGCAAVMCTCFRTPGRWAARSRGRTCTWSAARPERGVG